MAGAGRRVRGSLLGLCRLGLAPGRPGAYHVGRATRRLPDSPTVDRRAAGRMGDLAVGRDRRIARRPAPGTSSSLLRRGRSGRRRPSFAIGGTCRASSAFGVSRAARSQRRDVCSARWDWRSSLPRVRCTVPRPHSGVPAPRWKNCGAGHDPGGIIRGGSGR